MCIFCNFVKLRFGKSFLRWRFKILIFWLLIGFRVFIGLFFNFNFKKWLWSIDVIGLIDFIYVVFIFGVFLVRFFIFVILL